MLYTSKLRLELFYGQNVPNEQFTSILYIDWLFFFWKQYFDQKTLPIIICDSNCLTYIIIASSGENCFYKKQ